MHCIYSVVGFYIRRLRVAGTITSIRLDTKLADEAAEALGVKTRTEAVNIALREIVALKRFKEVLIQYGGKGEFAGSDE